MLTSKFYFINFLVISLATVLLAAFQTTIWFQLFGYVPAPILWLNIVLYIILYRRPTEAVLSIYALMILVNPFTVQPIGILWMTVLILYFVASFMKARFFWPGARYFMLASLTATVLFQVISVCVSLFFENTGWSFNFFIRLGEVILTPLVAVPMFSVLEKWDRLSTEELANEAKTPSHSEGIE